MEKYSEMLKSELIALCDKRGIDSSGLKAELIERLEAEDKKEVKKEVVEKHKVWNPQLFRYEYK
jgi:hypothetical protein